MESNTFSLAETVGNFNQAVRIPGSKSITNRAFLMAALADGKSVLQNILLSDDSRYFINCLQGLGIPLELSEQDLSCTILGLGGRFPSPAADLFVGNAGTAARFLTLAVCLGHGAYRFDGVPRMRERPMKSLLDMLQAAGITMEFEGEASRMPYTIHATGHLPSGELSINAASTSQQLSALLLCLPYAKRDSVINIDGELVSKSYINITLATMKAFGVEFINEGYKRFLVKGNQCYTARTYDIEPDASSACYFMAAAAVMQSRVRIERLGKASCQGDVAFATLLERMGCIVKLESDCIEIQGPEILDGVDVDMNDISDSVMTLAAIAPFARSKTTIRNVAHINLKETERIHATVTELRKMKVKVDEFEDGMTIYPGEVCPAGIDTYDDHRMAMAFAITAVKRPGVVVRDIPCCSKTFPEYFTLLKSLIGVA